MGPFIPNTKKEQEKMLGEIGYESFEDMLSFIPEEDRLKKDLDLPDAMSEMESYRKMKELASKNKVYDKIFRGAGSYDHYIPAIVKSVTSKEEFLTSYTPYQAEISQGVLQSIFEYQTMMCELTGMDVCNASHYDGATASAEAIVMAKKRRKKHAYVAGSMNPGYLSVIKTYCYGNDTELHILPTKGGKVDLEALTDAMEDKEASCFLFQQPNFFGLIEDAEEIESIVHAAKAQLIMTVEPTSLAIFKTPGEIGADIAVGDGQPLGMPISFGGPYLGFMAASRKNMRKLPGRIVGETEDEQGRRAYVLTLQAREQHIRREKASSNICSNQALCALTAASYMAAMGPDGMKEVALQSMSKAHYLAYELEKVGLKLRYEGEFYNEFVTDQDVDADDIITALDKAGILGGLVLEDGGILWCATEKNTKADIDELVSIVREEVGR